MKKVIDNVLTIGLVVVLIAMAALSLMLVISSSNDEVANVFGYSPITIHDTKSMEGQFSSSDLVIIKKTDPSLLKEKDIISFWGYVDGKRDIITHRIVEVIKREDGFLEFKTKGDSNPTYDQDPNPTLNGEPQDYIHQDLVIGVYVTQIPFLGAIVTFVKTPVGIMVCLVIPLAIIFLCQLIRVIRMAMSYHREAQAERNAQMSEDEKQRVIEEYLRQQQTAKETEDAQNDKSSVE